MRILRVEPASAEFGPGPPVEFASDWRAQRTARAHTELRPVANRFRESGMAAEVAIVFENDPAAAIMAAAADADLIVMTTQGRGATGRAIFGSVADRVARQTTTPVLLVRIGRRRVAPVAPTRIVIPLDGSPRAEQALPIAAKLARALRLPLRLVRVVDADREEIRQGQAQPEAWRQEAASYLAGQAARLVAGGLVVDHEVVLGDAPAALFCLIEPSDVVVMTSHGHGGALRRLLGSVAEYLVRYARGSVLLVPSAGRDLIVHARAGLTDQRSPGSRRR